MTITLRVLVISALLTAGCASSPVVRVTGDGGPDAARDGGAADSPVRDAPASDTPSDAGMPPNDTNADASVCGNAMGLHCGAALGLDANTLYACHDGMLAVADHCTGACIVHADGSVDACPCPQGDGTYCGNMRVPGGDPHVIYTCMAGHYAVQHRCGATCAPGSGAADVCPPCPFGNGGYCGGPLGGVPYVLYNCQNGVATPQLTCQSTCHSEPAGTNDHCDACQFGAGTYCGSGAHGDPNTLYDCRADGSIAANTVCHGTCHVSPPGVPDFCPGDCSTGLACGHVQWWNTALTYGPYQVGNGGQTWWDTDLAIGDRTPIQLRHDSVLLQAPVEPWGWQPRFRDVVTGQTFQFLHMHPDAQYTTTVGMTYCAGTVVGLSGGGDYSTGCCLPGRYSSGPHLCVETLATWRTAFPSGTDTCR